MTNKPKRTKPIGSGRKPSGIVWKTVSFRIQEEWREPVKVVVRKEIKRLKGMGIPGKEGDR